MTKDLLHLPDLIPATDRAFDVVAFGENSLDFVGRGPRPREGADKTSLSAFDLYVGGQASTAAVCCARQGLRSRYLGVFGTDSWGTTVRDALAREGVDVVAIERADARSRVALVLVESESGDRRVFEFRDPHLAMDAASLPTADLVSGRILMLDATDIAVSTAAARAARAAGVRTIVDVDRVVPNLAQLLAQIDVIVVPKVFLEEWTGKSGIGEALALIADEFKAPATVVTLGPDGSLALAHGREVQTPGFVVDVADSTGAGDAFRGGLASAWARLGDRADLGRILDFSNATAALNCSAVGAQTGLPGWDEVQRLVTTGPRHQSK